MKVQVLQHVPFEGIGGIGSWLEARRADIATTRFFAGDRPSFKTSPDLVLVMGGPMSVNDEETFPFLVEEKKYVRAMIDRKIPTIGICLGAQLIAAVMGSRVYKNNQPEIGWFDIYKEDAPSFCFQFSRTERVFHWHGETFDLPEGATRLASSKACKNQAFQIGKNVIGLQFHLETTPQSVALLVEHCKNELVPGPFVQTAPDILAEPGPSYARINNIMEDVLDYVVRRPRT